MMFLHIYFTCAGNMIPGKFDVFVSVGKRDGTPVIALPLKGDDGHKRYKIVAIDVKDWSKIK